MPPALLKLEDKAMKQKNSISIILITTGVLAIVVGFIASIGMEKLDENGRIAYESGSVATARLEKLSGDFQDLRMSLRDSLFANGPDEARKAASSITGKRTAFESSLLAYAASLRGKAELATYDRIMAFYKDYYPLIGEIGSFAQSGAATASVLSSESSKAGALLSFIRSSIAEEGARASQAIQSNAATRESALMGSSLVAALGLLLMAIAGALFGRSTERLLGADPAEIRELATELATGRLAIAGMSMRMGEGAEARADSARALLVSAAEMMRQTLSRAGETANEALRVSNRTAIAARRLAAGIGDRDAEIASIAVGARGLHCVSGDLRDLLADYCYIPALSLESSQTKAERPESLSPERVRASLRLIKPLPADASVAVKEERHAE
jgi:hypothetical protein